MTNESSSQMSWTFLGRRFSRNAVRRYFAMFNICFLGLGAFVSFDSVGALQQALMDKFNITFSEFSLMYSVNAWANILVSPFGGFLIDRIFGIRIGTIFYGCVFIVGHVIFSLGVINVTFFLSLFGRFINGVGHEFLYICLQLYSVYYFKGKELSLIMCTNISIARLGSSLVYSISEPLLVYVRTHFPGPSDVGIVVFILGCFMLPSMLSGIVLLIMTPKNRDSESVTNSEDKKAGGNNTHPKIKVMDLFNWSIEFWLLTIVQISFTVSIYVFLPFTQELFKTVNGLTVEEANAVTSFFNIVGVVFAPITGVIIDKVGREVYFMLFGFVCAFAAHTLIGFAPWSPYTSMLTLSLAYGLFNGSVLPMLAIIIPEYKLGTAYGVGLAFNNGAYAACVYLVGLTVDKFQYVGLAVFMLVTIAGGTLAAIYLMILDKKTKGILNISAVERRAVLNQEIKKQEVS